MTSRSSLLMGWKRNRFSGRRAPQRFPPGLAASDDWLFLRFFSRYVPVLGRDGDGASGVHWRCWIDFRRHLMDSPNGRIGSHRVPFKGQRKRTFDLVVCSVLPSSTFSAAEPSVVS